MDIDMQKLQAFLTTVNYGSITKAAEEMNYTQPGISRMIREMERDWGIALLDRDSSGVRLTSNGANLLHAIQLAYNGCLDLKTQIDDLNGLRTGLIRIGTFESGAIHWLPSIMTKYQNDYPNVKFEIRKIFQNRRQIMKPRDIFTKQYFLPALLMILVVAVMTGFSEGLEEREIIFPEITALAAGMILVPRRPWKVSCPRMIFFITLCAVCGTCIVRFVHLPLLAQMMIAYLAGQIILGFSGTTMAPMISAIALPVLLQSGALIYPVSAFLLTVLIVAVRKGMERAGLREPEHFGPVPPMNRAAALQTAVREVLVLILGAVCITAGWRFCIAPPLLVAFQEFTNPASPARRKPVKAVALIAVCAAIGSYARLFLCTGFLTGMHLPLTVCAVIVTAAIILAFFCFGMALPPAGALGILPMLVLPDVLPLFPLQILTGAAVLMAFACVFFRRPGINP